FSDEKPVKIREDVRQVVGNDASPIRKAKMPPSSNAFVPSVAGLIMASYVINELLKDIPIARVSE
ncbi:tRNA threonylcarbamoyladenosine dehydratase, partial [Geobacillus stearothermophilus]|nr:tRNA threonylcarbamoyladenosine dehydratase [Geobacillus stearothermophilus]